jgi:Tol biopolymer transport system component
MPLSAGDKLGPYEILAPIGAGGMGEVYRARDMQLKRDVALKVLPAAFSSDPERLARFQREAELLASLDHPNIGHIYGMVQSERDWALVLALIEGPTLGDRIAQGPVPPEEAIAYSKQIVDAMEYAHECGVIHRDLKPANIKINPDGVVKVLDFGLAKALDQRASATSFDPVNSPTLTMGATQAGVIMGTAAYMSPEQAVGKVADRRSDIFSFGVVLYEMLTGQRPFHGESMGDTLAAVVKDTPDWSALPAEVPSHLRKLLERMLAKDRKERLQAIGEARIILARSQNDEAVSTAGVAAPSSRPGRLPWIAAAGVMTIVAAIALWSLWRVSQPVEQALIRISGDLGAEAISGANLTVAISPDGKRIVYPVRTGGKVLLATRLLDQATPTLLSGTEGATVPFFSPDGQWIGFGAEGKLKKISVLGGAALALCDAPSLRGGSWGEDGNIIMALSSTPVGLSRVPDSGGQPQFLTKPQDQGDQRQYWPQLLPDGNAVLFAGNSGGNWDTANVEVLALKDGALKSGKIKILVRGGYSPHYLPAASGGVGHLVYIHEGVLLGVPFDPVKLELRGTPAPLLEDVAANSGQGGGQFDVSRTGSLVYLAGKSFASGVTVSWMDSSGKMEPLLAKPARYYHPRFSPDGNLLAISMIDAGKGGYDVYVYDWRHDTMPRLTFTGANNVEAEWSPDGKHLVYDSNDGLWWVRADGGGEPQRLLEGKAETNRTMDSFFPDGKRVSYSAEGPETKMDTYTVPLDLSDPEHPKAGKPEAFLHTPASEVWARFSPDGRWMAYTSDESGTRELYVRPFPGPGGRWQISSGGATGGPVWSRDGRQLFFGSPEFKIMVSDYTAKDDSFTYSKPRAWSDTALGGSPNGSDPYFDIAPDDKRFAVIPRADAVVEEKQGNLHATFLFNFADEVRRRVPVGK